MSNSYNHCLLSLLLDNNRQRTTAMSVSVCLSVCLSANDHIFGTTRPIFTNLLCMLPMTVAWSFSGGVVIRYVLPVLWMTSFLLISHVAQRRRPAEAQCTRSLGLGYKLCAIIPVAGHRTHGTTFRTLKLTSQVATPGAQSAIYDCLVSKVVKSSYNNFNGSWKLQF